MKLLALTWFTAALAATVAACGAADARTTDAVPADAPGDTTDAAALHPIERTTIDLYVDTCVTTPNGYGSYGAVTSYDRYEIANPTWIGSNPLPVQVLVPVGGAATHPVIFYGHPYGGTDWTRARGPLEFLVSHDYVVVFVPYATLASTVCDRYDMLWGGIAQAVARLGDQVGIDRSRFGVIGHSFGGGAAPWLARQALASGWGANGSFVYSNAPWYSYRMEAADWAALADTRLLLMMFEDDTENDHRIGIEQEWTPWQGPREYLRLPSSASGACTLTADHVVPNSVVLDGLDVWGVWRHAQAIAACALAGSAQACSIVDGGAAAELDLGDWLDASGPVPPAITTDDPMPVAPQDSYMFPFDAASQYPCDGTDS